jgi:hypothetical protein
VRKRLSLFGAGNESLFNRIGAAHALVGQAVSGLSVGKKSSKRGRILRASLLRRVRRSSGVVANEIVGNVSGRKQSNVVVAVNGRIEAAGSTWHLTGQRSLHFALNVPETSLREGRNSVQVYEVGKGRVLHLLASD